MTKPVPHFSVGGLGQQLTLSKRPKDCQASRTRTATVPRTEQRGAQLTMAPERERENFGPSLGLFGLRHAHFAHCAQHAQHAQHAQQYCQNANECNRYQSHLNRSDTGSTVQKRCGKACQICDPKSLCRPSRVSSPVVISKISPQCRAS